MRVYVPATLAELARWHAAGLVPAGGERFTAPDEQDDELAEYAALTAAAEASGELMSAPGRRVVVVAEVEDPDGEIPLRLVAAVHADTADVDPGDQDPPELAWFATQEIPALL